MTKWLVEVVPDESPGCLGRILACVFVWVVIAYAAKCGPFQETHESAHIMPRSWQ